MDGKKLPGPSRPKPPPHPSRAKGPREAQGAAVAGEQETLLAPKLSGSATHERVKRIDAPDDALTDAPMSRRPDRYIGTVIDGRYVVEEVIGEGGMGVVYKCRRKVFDRSVAVKILRSDLARNAEVTERFATEAKAASAIGNPHIVDVFDFGALPDGSTYFAMEYLVGDTLGGLLQSETLVGSDRVVPIGRQMAEGLAAAHKEGIVHRDLKPENVFITDRDGKDFVKILDFGIAKVVGLESKITRAGAVFGTPHYMSPEQCRGGTVDHRSNVYALGVLLYEMATGHVPFDAENPLAILSMHLNDPPRRFASFESPVAVPLGLELVVLKCLAKSPEDRFQSMADVANALAAVERGEAPEFEIHISVAPPDEPAPALDVDRPSFVDAPPPSAPPNSPVSAARASVVTPAIVVAPAQTSRNLELDLAADEAARELERSYRSRRWPIVVIVSVLALAAIGGSWLMSSMQVPMAGEAIQAGRPVILQQTVERQNPESTASEVSVALVLSPIDAHVSRNGHDLGKMPIQIPVKQTEPVEIEVTRDGYWSRKVTLDGKRHAVTVRLAPIQAGARPPASGKSAKSAAGAPPAAPEEDMPVEEDQTE